MNRNVTLARGEGPRRSSPLLPCGPGWKTREEAEGKAGGTGREAFPCPGRACPKWHLRDKPGARPLLSPAVPVRPRPARRETGFPRAVKLLARTRAGGGDIDRAACECCGKWLGRYGGEIQHRIARGSGGSRSTVINGIANAVLLCGNRYVGCHGRCENRDPEMKADGFYIPGGTGPGHDPRLVPLVTRREDGTPLSEWLTADGRRVDEDPGKTAAA